MIEVIRILHQAGGRGLGTTPPDPEIPYIPPAGVLAPGLGTGPAGALAPGLGTGPAGALAPGLGTGPADALAPQICAGPRDLHWCPCLSFWEQIHNSNAELPW